MNLGWRFLDNSEVVERVVNRWISTPYRPKARVRQQGVDCVQLIAALLDELYDCPFTPIVSVPSDVGFHDERRAIGSIRALRTMWRGSDVVRDRSVEPGDILVARISGRVVNHALFVTEQPMTVIHAQPDLGVIRQPLSHLSDPLRIYRPRMKHLWK